MVVTRSSTGFAAGYPLISALAKQDRPRIAALCKQQGLVSAAGPGNFTPLHFAVLLNDVESVTALLGAGASVDEALTESYRHPELSKWLRQAQQEGHSGSWSSVQSALLNGLDRGSTPLSMALHADRYGVGFHYMAVAKVLIGAGADVWRHHRANDWSSGYAYLPQYVQGWLLPHLLASFGEGQLVLTSQQLGLLLRLAIAARQPAGAVRILQQVATQVAPHLLPEDANGLLAWAVKHNNVQMAKLLLQLGASVSHAGSPYHKCTMTIAAEGCSCSTLQLLLEAGAPVTAKLVHTVIHRKHPSLLRALLSCRSIPVPINRPYESSCWTCPVLCLLEIKPKFLELPCVLRMAEMLADAGYTPTIYKDVPSFGSMKLAVYDPLKDPAQQFELEFSNRYTLLPFQAWAPRSNHKYPPKMRAAFRTLLLCAARGTSVGAGAGHAAGQAGRACSALAALPQELLLRVFQLSARHISFWVME